MKAAWMLLFAWAPFSAEAASITFLKSIPLYDSSQSYVYTMGFDESHPGQIGSWGVANGCDVSITSGKHALLPRGDYLITDQADRPPTPGYHQWSKEFRVEGVGQPFRIHVNCHAKWASWNRPLTLPYINGVMAGFVRVSE